MSLRYQVLLPDFHQNFDKDFYFIGTCSIPVKRFNVGTWESGTLAKVLVLTCMFVWKMLEAKYLVSKYLCTISKNWVILTDGNLPDLDNSTIQGSLNNVMLMLDNTDLTDGVGSSYRCTVKAGIKGRFDFGDFLRNLYDMV